MPICVCANSRLNVNCLARKPSLHTSPNPSIELPPEPAQVASLANDILAVHALHDLAGLVQTPVALPDLGTVAALESVHVRVAAWHDGRLVEGAIGCVCRGGGLVLGMHLMYSRKAVDCSGGAYLIVNWR